MVIYYIIDDFDHTWGLPQHSEENHNNITAVQPDGFVKKHAAYCGQDELIKKQWLFMTFEFCAY